MTTADADSSSNHHWLDGWRYFARRYQVTPRQAAICLLTSTAMLPAPWLAAWCMGHLVDVAIPSQQLTPVLCLGLALVAVQLTSGLLSVSFQRTVLQITTQAVLRVRDDLVDHVYALPRQRFTQQPVAALHALLVEDTQRVHRMSVHAIPQALTAGARAIVLVAILLSISPLLTLLWACSWPLLACIDRIARGIHSRHAVRFRRTFDEYAAGLLFALRTRELARVQGAEAAEIERQRGKRVAFADEARNAWFQEAYVLVQQTLFTAGATAVLLLGCWLTMSGVLAVGKLVTFAVMLGVLARDLRQIWYTVPRFLEGHEALDGISRQLQQPVPAVYSGARRIDFGGEIDVVDVGFSYGAATVLEAVHLQLRPGRITALCGANGAGKSTLIQLVLGLHRPGRGSLHADGQCYDELDLTDLRRQMGVLPQDPILFAGTIRENIGYGIADAADARIEDAARRALAHDFIVRCPRGYDTPVGDEGVFLSGGQAQRIALARAIVRLPRLLILDEPDNHLDQQSLEQLIANLRHLVNPPAILLVSHQAEVLRLADEVYQLAGGTLRPLGASELTPSTHRTSRPLAA